MTLYFISTDRMSLLSTRTTTWSDNTFKKFTIVGDLVLTFSLFLSLKNIDCLYSLAEFLFNFPLDWTAG